jgi:hypothetical protein
MTQIRKRRPSCARLPAVLLVACLLWATSRAGAQSVDYAGHTDFTPSLSTGVLAFDGVAGDFYTTPSPLPTDTLHLQLNDGSSVYDYYFSSVSFQIDNGLSVTSTKIYSHNPVAPVAGDTLISTIGASTLEFDQGSTLALQVQFNSATLNGSLGQNGFTIIAGSSAGVTLTAGPALALGPDTQITGISSPQGLTLTLSSTSGLSVSSPVLIGTVPLDIYSAHLDSLPAAQGTVSTSGTYTVSNTTVVPEPASAGLLVLGMMLSSLRRPRRRNKRWHEVG